MCRGDSDRPQAGSIRGAKQFSESVEGIMRASTLRKGENGCRFCLRGDCLLRSSGPWVRDDLAGARVVCMPYLESAVERAVSPLHRVSLFCSLSAPGEADYA